MSWLENARPKSLFVFVPTFSPEVRALIRRIEESASTIKLRSFYVVSLDDKEYYSLVGCSFR
jgi:hypothetical protein